MKVYGPENAHLIPKVQAILAEHIVDDVRGGIYEAYSELIDLVVSSSLHHSEETFNKAIKYAPAFGIEMPLLARFGRHQAPGSFRLTLSRVDPETLDVMPNSCLTVATVKPARQFEDIGETFTNPQIELVAKHAFEIIAADQIITTFGISAPPVISA